MNIENDAKKRDIRSERKFYEILSKVKQHHSNNGIGIGEIAKSLKIDRTTVTRICKTLVEEGLILKKNKQAKYHLTEMAFNEPMLFRRIYKTRQLEKIWHIKPNMIHCKTDGKRLQINEIKINKINKYLEIDNNIQSPSKIATQEEKDEIELFIFANKVGAIITYLFLQAIQPYQDNLEISDSKYTLLKKIDGRTIDDSIIRWIKQVIDPKEIFDEFCKLNIVNRGQQAKFNLSKYEINKDNYDKLLQTFQNVFPPVYEKIQEHTKIQYRVSKASIRWYEEYMRSERRKKED